MKPARVIRGVATLALLLSPAAAPSADGPDGAARLKRLFAVFDGSGPGCAYEVRRDRRIVTSGASGLADVRRRAPLTIDQALDVGSVSKSFTAAATLRLAEQGRLRLDAPIARYLAGLPEWSTRITVADLVYMRSGLPDFLVRSTDGARVDTSEGGDSLAGSTKRIDDPASIGDIFRAIRDTSKTDFVPGTRYAYSNTNYILLRLILERITHEPLAVTIRRQVLTPLAITPGDQRSSPVTGHRLIQGRWKVRAEPWDVGGASAFWISTDALARWGDALQSRTNEALRAVGIGRDAADRTRGYAAGLMTRHLADVDIIYHLGATGGFTAGVFAIPERRETIAFACNMAPDDLIAGLSRGDRDGAVSRYEEFVVLRTWLGR